ncbi:hypothetical protein K1X76_12530 [bacterium]|nr:hypothetical protein [bacterium]
MASKGSQKKISKQQVVKGLGTIFGSGLFLLLIGYWIQDKSPQITVRQFYNSVELKKAIPTQVGSLLIDYQPATQPLISEYVVQVTNEGRGPEEDVRLDIRFVNDLSIKQPNDSELRIYQPESASWNNGSYFVNLKQFPKDAFAPLSFEVTGSPAKLCETKIRIAGKQKEGKVEGLKGLACAL